MEKEIEENNQRYGTVALCGAPNAGKSTLLNALIGSKVSIVSPKVQTTRAAIRGILTEGNVQVVFIDTPGVFEPGTNRRLERSIVREAWNGIEEADVIAMLVDTAKELDTDSSLLLDYLKRHNHKAILILNKIDRIEKTLLLDIARRFFDQGCFQEIFMISALNQDGLGELKEYFLGHMPEGEWHYEEDQISTAPMRFLACEITREELFKYLHSELPYSLAVECDQWKEDKRSITIHQSIYVLRDSQKKIIIGSKGQQIKDIGTKARISLETLLGKKVNLFLHVKVRPEWIDNPEMYKQMGIPFSQ